MARSKKGMTAHRRHKKLLKLAKGYRGARHSVYMLAKQAVLRAGQYAYRDRKNRKRDFRRLWNVRISLALKEFDLSYSEFMNKLTVAKIELDRKTLSELAINNPEIFKQIVEKVK